MGGAFTGVADDYSALYYNPAGIAQIDGYTGNFEYLFVSPQVTVQQGGGPKSQFINKWTKAPMLGLTIDLSDALAFTKRRIVFGFAGIFPDNFKNVYKIRWGSFYDPYYPLYGDSTVDQTMCLWLDMAIEIFPWLYIGGGVTIQIHGQEILMNVVVDRTLTPIIEMSTSRLEITSELYPLAGVLVKPTERLRIGFAWRKEVMFIADGGNQMFLKLYLGPGVLIPVPEALIIPARGHFRPQQFALGASYRFTDRFLLAADLTYYDYGPYYDEGGRPLNPPMKGIFVPRIGLEYYVLKPLALRAGYSYRQSPLQDQVTGQPVTLLDNDVHSVSTGLGVFWNLFGLLDNPAQWSLYYQLQVLPSRTFQSVHPGEPDITSSGFFHSFGFGIQFKL